MDKKQVNISNFPQELKDDLAFVADNEHRSFQAQVIHVLKHYISGHPLIKERNKINQFGKIYEASLKRSKTQES